VGSIQIGNHHKNLPNHPIQFATLEIEISTATQKPPSPFHFPTEMKPSRWLFLVSNFNGWTNLPITPLERHICPRKSPQAHDSTEDTNRAPRTGRGEGVGSRYPARGLRFRRVPHPSFARVSMPINRPAIHHKNLICGPRTSSTDRCCALALRALRVPGRLMSPRLQVCRSRGLEDVGFSSWP
jgi:hypothetical protein